MKLEFDVNLETEEQEAEKNDGQVKINIPKEYETRFKVLNVRYPKKMSKEMRRFALRLIEAMEAKYDHAS